ncbi:MAG: hypothetical protein M3P24_02315, partial [Gemmatimonadota bacterium]|nr:hypothetical protein [Gemmatimonadota bacterium]
MNTFTLPTTDAGGSPIEELTRQRTLLQQWLARLDEVSSEAPAHVAARVRSDYLARLRAVTEQLGSHREALMEDLSARRADLDRAEGRLAEARDTLEEAHLRHLIGELADGDWTARRPELARAVETAEGEVERMRAEVEHLDSLLAEVPGERQASPASPAGDDTLPEYAPPAQAASAEPPPLPATEVVDGVDLAWLTDIGST